MLRSEGSTVILFAFVLALLLCSRVLAEEKRQLRLISSDGFDDPMNTAVGATKIHEQYLYLGTWNVANGCKMYRTKDVKEFELISTGGFGNVNNFDIISLEWFKGKLYVGTWNMKDALAVYRANADAPNAADIVWEPITADGFGDIGNKAATFMCIFKDCLYVGCFNPLSGPEVWRSATGDPGSWTQVNQDGWGFRSNSDATRMLVHDGYLYVGTESARELNDPKVGCQLWRTDGNLSPPYDQWEQVSPGGFGNPFNHNVCGLAMFNGKMYAGTWNTTQGTEVWRATPSATAPFSDWEKVNENGFGDPENIWTLAISAVDDTLYAGGAGKFEVEGGMYALLSGRAKIKYTHGGFLLKTTDGTTWERVEAPGFLEPPAMAGGPPLKFRGQLIFAEAQFVQTLRLWGCEPSPLRLIDKSGFDDPLNTGIVKIKAHEDYIYLGTWNVANGGKVYRSGNGENWELTGSGGLGSANNFCVLSFEWFNGKLYVGTWNMRDALQVFRANADADNAADIVWEAVTTDGFGDAGNKAATCMSAFNGHLYVGCFNPTTGPEVWRSASGNPGTFTQVNQDGWGFSSNSDATRMLVHDGYLYAGTESAREAMAPKIGCQLWRTDGNLSPPYDQWEQVNRGGFGDPANHNICGFGVFKNKIYAGTWNNTQGLEVWRATPSEKLPFPDWEQVNENGFGNPENIWTIDILVLDDTLYLTAGGKFTLEGGMATFWLPGARIAYAHAGTLVKTTDGTTWERIEAPGFLEPSAIGATGPEAFRGRIFVGEFHVDEPLRLWLYEAGRR